MIGAAMFKNLSALSLVLIFVLLTGCAIFMPWPDYSYTTTDSDATLVFNSEFDTYTSFAVNINPIQAESANEYKNVGYISHSDSIFVLNEPNPEIRANVPGDQPVAVWAKHNFTDGNSGSSCGPLIATFIAEKNKTYIVTMHRRDGGNNKFFCRLSVRDQQGAIPLKPSPQTVR